MYTKTKRLLVVLLFLFCHQVYSQTKPVNRDSLEALLNAMPFQHPVLQAIERGEKEQLFIVSNPEPEALVVACAIDKRSQVAYFFTRYGLVQDYTTMDPAIYQAVLQGKQNIFRLYTSLLFTKLEAIDKAADELRFSGLAAYKKPNINPWLQLPVVQQAQTSLEKLFALDKCRNHHVQKLVDYTAKIRRGAQADSLRNTWFPTTYKPGSFSTSGSGDSAYTTYYNTDPFSSVYKAVVYHANGSIFLYDRQEQHLNTFTIKAEKVKELVQVKTSPFVLYRGWLEWQLQQGMDYVNTIEKRLKKEKARSKAGPTAVSNTALLANYRAGIKWLGETRHSLIQFVQPNQQVMALEKELRGSRTWDPVENRWVGTSGVVTRGNRYYELTDHRGNVIAVISDKKRGIDKDSDGVIDYYEAEVVSTTDYTPFGAPMVGRTYNSSAYRYGFNGKENDKETSTQDYGMRIYDPRLGRFLSVDPLTQSYPWYTPYQFAGNTPIQAIDLDGAEEYHYTLSLNKDGSTTLKKISTQETKEVSTWMRIFTFGLGPKSFKIPERAAVDYNGEKYYIGFEGSYGRGNENGMATFNQFLQAPDATLFPSLFNSEKNAYWTEATNASIMIMLNRAMYGNITESTAEAQKKLQVGKYSEMKKANAGSGLSADHIPSFASLRANVEEQLGRKLTAAEANMIKNESLTLVYETEIHRSDSRTYGGRNNPQKVKQDASNLLEAIKKDINALRPALLKAGYSEKEINNASNQLFEKYETQK